MKNDDNCLQEILKIVHEDVTSDIIQIYFMTTLNE